MLIGVLKWDVSKLARELHLTEDETIVYFQDGRRCSFITERRIAREFLSGHIADSEGAAFDLYDKNEKRWEVRSLTSSGIYFCPSYMVGSGRKFEESGFLEKVSEIEGYLIAKIDDFPKVPVYQIQSSRVLDWYYKGELGKNTSVSLSKMEKLLSSSTH